MFEMQSIGRGILDGPHPVNALRFVLLNHLISRSAARARYAPPIHGATELLEIIGRRKVQNWTIEFEGMEERDSGVDDAARIAAGKGLNCLRLREIKWEGTPDEDRVVTLFFEYIDQSVRTFPVVHTTTYGGREIAGEDEERGATAAHVVILLPPESALNIGRYRCAIETVSPITRTAIENFLCRQIRRHVAQAGGWTFPVVEVRRRNRPVTKEYQYTPRLELVADAGRALTGDGRVLTAMTFTKRKERLAIGQPAELIREDVIGDVQHKINAQQQGPSDPEERQTWALALRKLYEERGFKTRLYFRHAVSGAIVSGEVHPAVASATDLIMCPTEIISFTKPLRPWRPDIDPETVEKMKDILNTDSLWQRTD
jgi:hypothetical protein